MLKSLLLVVLSTVMSLAVLVVGYELMQKKKYESWRAKYENNGDWLGGLTVASSDSILMWEYHPEREYLHPKYGTVTRTNEFGFRQKSGIHLAPPAGTRRVAFIGDSVTLGREVEFEQTFSQVTEWLMNGPANSVQYEALNFAIDGYNTPQILHQLITKVFQFSPDLVIYSLCLNDFDFEEASALKIRFFKKPESFFLEALAKVTRRFSANDYHTYFFNQNKEAVFDDITAMQSVAQKRGIDVLVLILPVFKGDRLTPFGGIRRFQIESFADYHLRPMHDEIVRMLRAREINTVDLLPRFADSGRAPAAFAYDVWHMNAAGHDLVGKAIVELLIHSSPPSL